MGPWVSCGCLEQESNPGTPRVCWFTHTVDGQNPAPLRKPWGDDSRVDTNKRYGFTWFHSGAISGFRNHPQYMFEGGPWVRCGTGIRPSDRKPPVSFFLTWLMKMGDPTHEKMGGHPLFGDSTHWAIVAHLFSGIPTHKNGGFRVKAGLVGSFSSFGECGVPERNLPTLNHRVALVRNLRFLAIGLDKLHGASCQVRRFAPEVPGSQQHVSLRDGQVCFVFPMLILVLKQAGLWPLMVLNIPWVCPF